MSRPRMLYLGVLAYLFGLGLSHPIFNWIGSGSISGYVIGALIVSPLLLLLGAFVGALTLDVAYGLNRMWRDRSRSTKGVRRDMLKGVLWTAGFIAYIVWVVRFVEDPLLTSR